MKQYNFLYLFYLILVYAERSECVTFKKFLVVADSKMQDAVSKFPLGSSTACGNLCNGRKHCFSYGYTKSTKTCTINDKDPNSAPSKVVTSPGSSLYVKDCEKGWHLFLGSCYLFSTKQRSWVSSKAYCESFGANLVKVENAEEHQYIRQTVTKLESEDTIATMFWIGASYNYTAGEHRWTDGSKMTFNGWKPGFPGTQKGCVDYLGSANWLWNSHSDCVSTNCSSICETLR